MYKCPAMLVFWDENMRDHCIEAINSLNASWFRLILAELFGKRTIEPDILEGAVLVSEYKGKRYFIRRVNRRES